MEGESFEDEEVASLLNLYFIPIKVDREERPDIDSIYMSVCQMMTGQGGWPLNVFLTPDQKPFYAGTYFPKHSHYNRPGMMDILPQLAHIYESDQERITAVTKQLMEGLQNKVKASKETALHNKIIHSTFQQLASNFDTIYGGFGGAPKFPSPHMLMYLLRYQLLTENEQALYFVKKTLDGMANGGIYDHVGFGFARYATDETWLVPHFEKMLYDNALLLHAYTEGYQVFHDDRYKQVAEEIVTFIKREMTDKNGSFYSALDADSEGVEGKYYVWSKAEIIEVLGDELGALYCKVYDVTEEGNFEGANIPNLIHTDWQKIAEQFELSIAEIKEKLEIAREVLLAKRSLRIYPHLDDKVLTSWNALMISALAKASRVFGNEEYVQLAKGALAFIEEQLIVEERVMARYRDGEVKYKGYIDDYAYLLWAYMEMYETTFDISYVKKAKEIVTRMNTLFWDQDNGGFFFTGNDGEELLIRDKEVYDGAMPSGNSVAAVQLLRLSSLIGDETFRQQVEEMYTTFSQSISSYGSGHAQFLQSLLFMESPRKEIVIVGEDSDERQRLVKKLQGKFAPNYSVLIAASPNEFAGIADFAVNHKKIGNELTVYICQNYACEQPLTDMKEILKKI
ncbi:thioredoxin domain-containing protein [Bacillus sp. DX4.1]|uniref:thioredoxin domain-containing protein n=1 Tax=Bacillus sp. DX4.1 TaxID=3055867 RepID=UPI00259FE2A5|nr:thioredoxin domain-containing protein [Bacillus sp. DX4.1]MDM5189188.1 thioredoxin domain-containing protein [Bacillus sp. DX4.1]